MDEPPIVFYPGFYRVFMQESSAERLSIPSGFVERIQEAWPEIVTIRDRYNNLWQVKVEKVGDTWYFKDGWTKFVADNLFDWGDILTFSYIAEGIFAVKIFGPNACEKKGGPICKSTEEQDKVEDLDENEIEDDDIVVLYEQDNEDDDSGKQVVDAGAAASGSRPGSRRITDWYDTELFKSGLARQPMNPYFVTRTKLNRKNELYIPTAVISFHKLELPSSILFVDERGMEFPSRRKMWKDGRTFYAGGWKDLCSLNLVDSEDKCICEFIRGRDRNLSIHVRFVRANRD